MGKKYGKRIYQIKEKIFIMFASHSGNAHDETLTNYTTYNKTNTPK